MLNGYAYEKGRLKTLSLSDTKDVSNTRNLEILYYKHNCANLKQPSVYCPIFSAGIADVRSDTSS